ncbi:MAG TPA: c-type cytochrome, partial [Luteolibacter sp.]|nr:c-type cytochrome [Luteolibacter sp.]
AADTSLSEDARTEALWLIKRFEKHPPTDPTTGMYRPIAERQLGEAIQKEIHDALVPLLSSATGNVLVEAMGLAGKYQLHIPQQVLIGQLIEPKNPLSLRLAALKEIQKEQPADFTAMLVKLGADPDAGMRAEALKTLARSAPEDAFALASRILTDGSIGDKQLAIGLLATLEHPKAADVLLQLMKGLGAQPIALQLDILEAAKKRGGAELEAALAAYEAALPKDDPLAAFQVALEGGNVINGRNHFFKNGKANCVQCHKVGQRGGEAGPNLQGVGKRQDAKYILEAIIAPSAKLAPGYSPIAVTMKDGTIVAGMLMKQTPEEVVVRAFGTQNDTVCKTADIQTIPPVMSPMPPMGAVLSKAEIRDLVAFLTSLKE